jgi:hypothetical protein
MDRKGDIFECDSRQAVIDLLDSQIEGVSCPGEVRFEICDMLAPLFVIGDQADAKPPRRMMLRSIRRRDIYYAIHNDDLLLFKAVVAAILLFFASDNLLDIGPKFVASLVLLAYTYRKKAIEINGTQAMVLQALKSQRGGMDLSGVRRLCGGRLEEADVEKVLTDLKRVFRVDGTATSLVEQDNYGLWHAVDV